MIHPMPFCFSLYCASLIEITLYKHYATVRRKIQFFPNKYSHPSMFLSSKNALDAGTDVCGKSHVF